MAAIADVAHCCDRCFGADQQREDVGVEHGLPLLWIAAEHVAEERDAGVVDEDVEVAVGIECGR